MRPDRSVGARGVNRSPRKRSIRGAASRRGGNAGTGDASTASRRGLRLCPECGYRRGGLMAILLVVGVMDLRTMAVVTATLAAERLAPATERFARAIGGVVIEVVCVLEPEPLRPAIDYSTVTDLARLRGLSTSVPRSTAA
jgi:hypothetical protein